MKIVIIDDEQKARSLLRTIISQLNDEALEVFEAESLLQGVELIQQNKPRLVFLDIEMPNEKGTEILKYFAPSEISFELVFTTAYSEYALTAFEMNAIDYILKPIRPKRVLEVIEKVKVSFNQKEIQHKLTELNTSLQTKSFKKIGVPINDGIAFLDLEKIIHLEADGMYTKIFCTNASPMLVSKPLKFFNHLVELGNLFYRPHRSHIFNINYIKQYVKKDGHYILLENDQIIPISKEKKEDFLKLVSGIV